MINRLLHDLTSHPPSTHKDLFGPFTKHKRPLKRVLLSQSRPEGTSAKSSCKSSKLPITKYKNGLQRYRSPTKQYATAKNWQSTFDLSFNKLKGLTSPRTAQLSLDGSKLRTIFQTPRQRLAGLTRRPPTALRSFGKGESWVGDSHEVSSYSLALLPRLNHERSMKDSRLFLSATELD
jgi:hypothetical protein